MSPNLVCPVQDEVYLTLEEATVACDLMGSRCTGIRQSELTRPEIRACRSDKTENDIRSSLYTLPGMI